MVSADMGLALASPTRPRPHRWSNSTNGEINPVNTTLPGMFYRPKTPRNRKTLTEVVRFRSL